MNPLRLLRNYGQSVWIDYIRRGMITSGELRRLVEEDGLRGVTTNPTIFEKAIDESQDYDDALKQARRQPANADPRLLYESLCIEDVRMAADVLRPVWEESGGADGYVSIEVSPQLAYDTAASVAEARRLWLAVDRPNLMVKIPATPAGIPAIDRLLAEGVNVNVTLMFSLRHYEAVAQAYRSGVSRAPDPPRVASVTSIFVSRVDTSADQALEAIGTPEALDLRGKIAIANARMIYHRFREIFFGDAFAALRRRGVRIQRVLWGSTGTKNPAYSDVRYVEELIGPDTVNTLPPATLKAFREHGRVRGATVQEGLEEARGRLERLRALGVDLQAITEKLQRDGVASFRASLDKLLSTLDRKQHAIVEMR